MDEWTKADTGVGAAIAAGSQEEKGNCALLVIAATKIKMKLALRVGILEADTKAKLKIPGPAA